MKKRYMILGCAAAVLIALVSVPPALAYFTAHMEASGSVAVSLGDTTHINERFGEGKKIVTITQTEGQPVYVRVQAFAAAGQELSYEGAGWVNGGDGFWYYTDPIAGASTGELNIAIPQTLIKGEEDFNIVVVYESTPALFGEDGQPTGYQNANWDTPAQVIE